MAVAPTDVFGIQTAGHLAVGTPADLAIFDLTTASEIKREDFLSKGHNSPFVGETVHGGTKLTLVDGEVAYRAK